MKEGQRHTSAAVNRILIAAAILFIVLIPAIYFYNTFLHPHKLVLDKKIRNVTIKRDHMTLLLAPGDYIKEGYELTTGEKSKCTIQYARKSTIAMDEKAEINITEFSSNRILLGLDAGEIHVKEGANKGAAIHINTPLVYIYAIGTDYSVKHTVNDMETIVKVFEGLVHIETIPRKDETTVKAGEEVIIRQDAAPVKRESGSFEEPGWRINTFYSESSVNKAITGFDGAGGFIIAGTERSLVCFTGDKIRWKYDPEDAYFIARPVIYNDKVYIPGLKNILCFDLFTGIKESGIQIRDTIRSGHHLIHYKRNLYIVFASGIYMYDEKSGSISTGPIIPVIDAALPAFSEDTVYITSYITGYIHAFELSGKMLWSLQLDDKCTCSPVAVDKVILAGTISGTLYKITTGGKIEKGLKLKESIISIVYGNDRIFFVLTGEGKFYEIGLHALDIEKVYYKVDTGIIYGNFVFMGMTGSTIKIMDLWSKKELEIPLSYSEASVFAGYDDTVYAGLKNGSIVKLEKQMANR